MKPTKRKRLTKESEKTETASTVKAVAKEKIPPSTKKAKFSPPKDLCFKKPEFQTVGFTQQVKAWKNIKHIASIEKSSYEQGAPTHFSITASPSTKPTKNFSDLSGLPALYKDPRTGLRYSNKEEYQALLNLSPDVVVGLLSLRKA